MVVANVAAYPVYVAVESTWGDAAALGFGAFVSELGLFVPLVVVVVLFKLDRMQTFGLRRPRLRPMAAALAATIGAGLVVDELMFLVLRFKPEWRGGNLEAVGEIISEAGLPMVVALLLPLALLPSLVEELLCRGILLRGILKEYPSWIALGVSSVFFGALHMDPLHATAATMMGLVLGWIALRTGSLWPPVFCHLVNNAISLLTPMLSSTGLREVLYQGHSTAVTAGGVTALLGGLFGLWWTTRGQSGISDQGTENRSDT
jgi:membrane protease YdiL (CAAX protease family)